MVGLNNTKLSYIFHFTSLFWILDILKLLLYKVWIQRKDGCHFILCVNKTMRFQSNICKSIKALYGKPLLKMYTALYLESHKQLVFIKFICSITKLRIIFWTLNWKAQSRKLPLDELSLSWLKQVNFQCERRPTQFGLVLHWNFQHGFLLHHRVLALELDLSVT